MGIVVYVNHVKSYIIRKKDMIIGNTKPKNGKEEVIMGFTNLLIPKRKKSI